MIRMIQEFTSNPLFYGWPFWMLELTPSADARDVEKAYAKITGQLKLQIPNVAFYPTPLGTQERDEFQLRDAKAILLDPAKRALAEFWYVAPNALATINTSPKAEEKSALDWKKILGSL